MKKIKAGFSLAEILIAIGIVSVIATMGFTIAKHSIDRAYEHYIYTGYMIIAAAISDASANDKNIEWETSFSNQEFTNHVLSLLNATVITKNSYCLSFKTNNGINFLIQKGKDSTSYFMYDDELYYILMAVPKRATRNVLNNQNYNSTKLFVPFVYRPKYKTLLPLENLPSGQWDYSSLANDGSNTYQLLSVIDRKDLLPFYIDDGDVGRYVKEEGVYKPKTYYSAKEAFCKVYNTIYSPHNSTEKLLDCTSITGVKGTGNGFVKAENPRKVW